MKIEIYVVFAALILGFGLMGILIRKNMFSIIVSILHLFIGGMIFFSALIRSGPEVLGTEVHLMMIVATITMSVFVCVGCVITYRWFIYTSGQQIDEEATLKH